MGLKNKVFKEKKFLIIVVVIVLILIILLNFNINEETISPYLGQETRGIKSLSQQEVEGLMVGEGTPFGGMAKLAELNGYPGPRHVLDLTGELGLTNIQKNQIELIYNEMNSEAIILGEQIIEIEKGLNSKFEDGLITENYLEVKVDESAKIYGKLRNVHLQAHLKMMEILNPEQVKKYNELRGYSSNEDPCENIPEGHDPVMWRMHKGC